ncbi:MAG TPA: biotin/lipoyl-binding protein, partial [Armatimonadetes bacterium]|nr:biotin/lipoyl-binding protein [Armatimonadota bacterium]
MDRRVIYWGGAAVVVALLYSLARGFGARPAVEAMLVRRGTLTAELSTTGTVEAPEITLSAKTAGRLRDVLVDEGDAVVRGQVLARLENTLQTALMREAESTLAASQARTSQAAIAVDLARSQTEAQVAQAEAALRAAEARLEQLRRGARPEERR